MKWFVTYEKNDNRIFCQKADTREAACETAFDKIKELTEAYRKQGVQYKWTDKGNEICVETDTEMHRFSVCSADEYYFLAALLVLVAILSLVFWIVLAVIFWQEMKKAVISYLLILALPVILFVLSKLFDTDARKGIEREAITVKLFVLTAALWVSLIVILVTNGCLDFMV